MDLRLPAFRADFPTASQARFLPRRQLPDQAAAPVEAQAVEEAAVVVADGSRLSEAQLKMNREAYADLEIILRRGI